MRVEDNNRWGYSFKEDSGITPDQKVVLGANLARLHNEGMFFKHSEPKPDDEEHYLPEDVASIMGIGPPDAPTSIGIVWSMDEKRTIESLFYASMDDNFYPYKIVPGKRYFVKNGEVYETSKAPGEK